MRSAAARVKIVVRTGGDRRCVGASFLHNIGRLFTLTAKPRTSGQLKITNDKKTGMGDALTATIATSVEYGIIFSGNKSTLMMLFCRDARCEQHKIRCSHYFLCYFDGDERDAQALYGLRPRSLRLFPSRHIIPPLWTKAGLLLEAIGGLTSAAQWCQPLP